MKKQLRYLLMLVFIVFGTVVFAQPPGGPGGPADGEPVGGEGSTDVPIDGGAFLLLAAGAAYGAKKLRDKKKKEE
jgi:hypothetical protein